ncbi:MAG: alpha-ketoglutarate-dependent dioxygenase AlkB [Christiangramia sp.]|nr:alpha-ketoglutarate-dependent dioxygenase AlkB [Christiangramia sp.]
MKNQRIALPDSEITYYLDFYSKNQTEEYLRYFENADFWKQEPIKIFGREILQPRLTALFGEENTSYTYSGLQMKPLHFPDILLKIKEDCEKLSNSKFNICLANCYRNGQDSMGWHSDDEKELGKNPTIASVSFGAERSFHFKHRHEAQIKHKMVLQNGSVLIMSGATQHFYKHQVPKTKKPLPLRVNLTFRKVGYE